MNAQVFSVSCHSFYNNIYKNIFSLFIFNAIIYEPEHVEYVLISLLWQRACLKLWKKSTRWRLAIKAKVITRRKQLLECDIGCGASQHNNHCKLDLGKLNWTEANRNVTVTLTAIKATPYFRSSIKSFRPLATITGGHNWSWLVCFH